jgi:hypothetical protein
MPSVPRDGRPQLTALDVIVGHIDKGWPALGSAGWRQVLPGVDSYMLEEGRPRRESVEVTGWPAEERAEAPKTGARALWPNLP